MKKIGFITLLIVCIIALSATTVSYAIYIASTPNQTIVDLSIKTENEENELNFETEDEENELSSETENTEILPQESVLSKFLNIDYIECFEAKKIIELYLPECNAYIESLNNYSVDERWLNEYDIISEEIKRINNIKNQYENQLEYLSKFEEYPVATEIWFYLKGLGYNDYVCAGILGNMMTEAGGQSLNINPSVKNSSGGHYGVCQWSIRYYPEVNGTDLNFQLNYLANSIKYQINTYGNNYSNGFNYEEFLQITDAKEAALSFALTYERCGDSSYEARQNNAIFAYEYFVN